MAPGILGSHPPSTPHAYTAFAPVQFHGGLVQHYAAPPSVAAAPTYSVSLPMPQYLQLPPHFGPPATSPIQAAPPSSAQPGAHFAVPTPTHAFHQTTLINALQDMSMHGGWVADPGASTHMTNNQGILFNSRPTDSYAPVVLGNGSIVPMSHIGHSSFQSPTCSMHLNDVLVVPNLVKDLIFVRRFTTDNLLSMEFDPYGLSVKDYRTKEVLHRCDITGKLYPIFSVSSSSSTLALCANTITKDTWHHRLGHPGISSSFNKQFPCNNLCETCQLGNHLSLPFFLISAEDLLVSLI
jgi:hypothetical protein